MSPNPNREKGLSQTDNVDLVSRGILRTIGSCSLFPPPEEQQKKQQVYTLVLLRDPAPQNYLSHQPICSNQQFAAFTLIFYSQKPLVYQRFHDSLINLYIPLTWAHTLSVPLLGETSRRSNILQELEQFIDSPVSSSSTSTLSVGEGVN